MAFRTENSGKEPSTNVSPVSSYRMGYITEAQYKVLDIATDLRHCDVSYIRYDHKTEYHGIYTLTINPDITGPANTYQYSNKEILQYLYNNGGIDIKLYNLVEKLLDTDGFTTSFDSNKISWVAELQFKVPK